MPFVTKALPIPFIETEISWEFKVKNYRTNIHSPYPTFPVFVSCRVTQVPTTITGNPQAKKLQRM